MNQSLFNRYFPVPDEEEAKREDQKWETERALIQTLVSAPGWKTLRDKVDSMLNNMEVRPGEHTEMLYQVGRRDAVQAFRLLLAAMENELRGGR